MRIKLRAVTSVLLVAVVMRRRVRMGARATTEAECTSSVMRVQLRQQDAEHHLVMLLHPLTVTLCHRALYVMTVLDDVAYRLVHDVASHTVYTAEALFTVVMVGLFLLVVLGQWWRRRHAGDGLLHALRRDLGMASISIVVQVQRTCDEFTVELVRLVAVRAVVELGRIVVVADALAGTVSGRVS